MQFISNRVSIDGHSKILYWIEYSTKTFSKRLSQIKHPLPLPLNSLQKLSLPHEAPTPTNGNTILPNTQASNPRVTLKCSISKGSPNPTDYFFEAPQARASSICQPPRLTYTSIISGLNQCKNQVTGLSAPWLFLVILHTVTRVVFLKNLF